MADSIELRASVTSIKRVDPYVKDILATATQVALYKFNTSSNEWEKTDKEGALFIYSRNGEPFHSIMIVNRLNKDNFIEPIVKNFDYQMQAPFLLYRNSKSKIFGIWFFNSEECVRITLLVETLMERFKDKSGDTKPKHINQNTNGLLAGTDSSVDIFAMLSKAQEDFNKTPVKHDATAAASSSSTFSSTPRVPDMTPQSVMDFFAKASTKTSQKPISTGNTSENVLHRLMSNPAHSVEHIEKQQRSVTPQEQVGHASDRRSAPINLPSKSADIFDRFVENGFGAQTVSPPRRYVGSAPSPLAFVMPNSDAGERLAPSPFAQFLENSQKPLLMTPMMFTAPANVKSSADLSGDAPEHVEMLTEKQLAQALIHLLKTNKDFIKQVHQAYVNSILDKVNSGNVDR
ncbi:mRNA-decapping enzyme 1B [Cylas formicarius]|uniref:mRNA-decapping enzyme 1B n=1 Tax=Cylas formicarius TaxID=197179 RepID=UPI0029587968|nr:mRNA-decapping enzyme 1B [Cylas formicarius]